MEPTTAQEASAEAVHKAKNAAQALELARQVQQTEMVEEIKKAVIEAFSAGVDNGRYIDISRIPLICQSIVGIDKKLDDLVSKQEFWPVKTLVYGITALMLSAIVGALMLLIVQR